MQFVDRGAARRDDLPNHEGMKTGYSACPRFSPARVQGRSFPRPRRRSPHDPGGASILQTRPDIPENNAITNISATRIPARPRPLVRQHLCTCSRCYLATMRPAHGGVPVSIMGDGDKSDASSRTSWLHNPILDSDSDDESPQSSWNGLLPNPTILLQQNTHQSDVHCY